MSNKIQGPAPKAPAQHEQAEREQFSQVNQFTQYCVIYFNLCATLSLKTAKQAKFVKRACSKRVGWVGLKINCRMAVDDVITTAWKLPPGGR